MTEISTDTDLDQLIWMTIQGSHQASDYLNYIRQSSDREIQYEEAFKLAGKYWGKSSGEPVWPLVIQKLEELAQSGSIKAIMRLGNWYRFGYGVDKDTEKSLAWYKEGMELFDANYVTFQPKQSNLRSAPSFYA